MPWVGMKKINRNFIKNFKEMENKRLIEVSILVVYLLFHFFFLFVNKVFVITGVFKQNKSCDKKIIIFICARKDPDLHSYYLDDNI